MTHRPKEIRPVEKKATVQHSPWLRAAILAIASAVLAGPASAQVISNVVASSVTNTSAVITWTTDQPSSSLVNYGFNTSYGLASPLNPALVTAHTVTLTGLAANTLYDFDVVSGNTSANFAFATLSTSPVLGNINAIYITSTSATINWTTDLPSTALVNYGTTTSYGSSSPLNSSMATAHSVTLNGLSPGTTYNFDVVSAGAANVNSTSANQTFTTAAAGATAPNVGFVASYGYTNTSAVITWSTDSPGNTVLAYGTSTALGQFAPVQATLSASHGVTLTGLYPGTTYYFVCESTGAGGATGYSATYSFATTGTPTLVPILSNVTSSNLTPSSATITWTTNVPSNSLVNYGTTTSYGFSVLESTLSTNHSVTLTGLAPGTNYVFEAVSASPAGVSTFGANLGGFTIWAWGDSQTVGGKDGSNINYPNTLANILGVPVINEGVGGNTSTQIAQRMLATPASFGAGNCNVIWGGSNNPTQVSQILADDASMVDALATPACYLVMGDVNWVSTPIGTSTYNDIVATGEDLAAAYPNNYINIRELVVQDYNPSLPLDVADHANDVMPSSLRAVVATGTVTSGPLDNETCTFSVTGGTQGDGTVIIIDSETILINSIPDGNDVTSCTRGYNLTAAASHAANAIYSVIDPIHLGYNGLEFVASQVANWFQSQTWPLCPGTGLICPFPANFTTPTTMAVGPVISAVTVSSITSTSAVVTWTTDQPSTSLVNYGVTSGYGSSSTLNSTLQTSQSVTLTGLTPGTTYDFDVVSVDAGAGSTTSGNSTFMTAALVSTPPVITNVATTNVTSTSVTVTWTTDQPATSQINYGTTTGYGSSTTLDTAMVTAHSETITGLAAGTAYDFDVVSANAASQSTTSPNSMATTTAANAIPPYVGYVAAWGIESAANGDDGEPRGDADRPDQWNDVLLRCAVHRRGRGDGLLGRDDLHNHGHSARGTAGDLECGREQHHQHLRDDHVDDGPGVFVAGELWDDYGVWVGFAS
ncbi:MAG: fibronectin type III domain-containing protein [Acidobacteriaceae bacterium]